jgi:hypothetical protein
MRPLRLITLVILVCSSLVGRAQQNIVISWPSKQLLSQPLTINGSTSVNVVLQNVNDALYTYQVTLTATPIPTPSVLTSLTGGGTTPTLPPECDAPNTQLTNIAKSFTSWQLNPWVDSSGKTLSAPQSVALSTTLAFYSQSITVPLAGVKPLLSTFGGACSNATVLAAYSSIDTTDKLWQVRLGGSHSVTVSAILEPLNNYTINIGEYSIGDSTHPPTLTSACTDSSSKGTQCLVQYQPQTDIITVSGGFLFSELPARTYSRGTVPNSTDAVLVVNGNSMSSLLAALVNVKLPCQWGWCPRQDKGYSLALSVGPVYSLNGTDVSKVGLFAGGSVGL